MNLEILPTRTGGAAENMATDFLLLQRYPQGRAPRFRHYGWRAPAFTFGYAQKIAFVRAQLPSFARPSEGRPSFARPSAVAKAMADESEGGPSGEPYDLCRRPTGGGIVDHREDWTYALVIPRGHPLEEARATQSYRLIHEALADALRAQEVNAITKRVDDAGAEQKGLPSDLSAIALATAEGSTMEGLCFQRAEIHDVVRADSGAKIAGAAQKRNKHGLLFQGSVWKPATGRTIDWEKFAEAFVQRLATALDATSELTPWPDFNEDEVSGLTEQYASPEWIEQR